MQWDSRMLFKFYQTLWALNRGVLAAYLNPADTLGKAGRWPRGTKAQRRVKSLLVCASIFSFCAPELNAVARVCSAWLGKLRCEKEARTINSEEKETSESHTRSLAQWIGRTNRQSKYFQVWVVFHDTATSFLPYEASTKECEKEEQGAHTLRDSACEQHEQCPQRRLCYC